MSFSKLITWSQSNYSYLPWRVKRTFYTTLVSEIMLQQTTVGTVVGKFDSFIEQFPNLKALAKASEKELTIAWKGLGYYRRARNLKKAAEYLADIPKPERLTFEELLQVPGVGVYTASALKAIGLNEPYLAVDANLERVIARYFGIEGLNGEKLKKEIYKQFNEKRILKNLKSIGPRDFNEAIMDLGRVYCQLNKTECPTCPLKGKCSAKKEMKISQIPLPKEKKKKDVFHRVDLYRVVYINNNKLLVIKRAKDQWLSGQYEVPTLVKKNTEIPARNFKKLESEFIKTQSDYETQLEYKTGITQYRFTNRIIQVTKKSELPKEVDKDLVEWIEIDYNSNLTRATIKALELVR